MSSVRYGVDRWSCRLGSHYVSHGYELWQLGLLLLLESSYLNYLALQQNLACFELNGLLQDNGLKLRNCLRRYFDFLLQKCLVLFRERLDQCRLYFLRLNDDLDDASFLNSGDLSGRLIRDVGGLLLQDRLGRGKLCV